VCFGNVIGIAFEDIPRVLAPFEQVDRTLTRKYEGAGLGLPLSKSYVEMHGGSFDLQSKIGVGTTVTVRFPAERIISEVGIGDRITVVGEPIAEIKRAMAVRKGNTKL
jgi:signal transduction histidine kinase